MAKAKQAGIKTRLKSSADSVLDHELLLLAVALPILVLPRAYIWKFQRGLNAYAPLEDSSLAYPGPLTYLALGLIALPWLLRLARRGHLTSRTPLDGPIALYVLTAAIGLWPSVDPAFSLDRFLGMVAGVALYYGLVNWAGADNRLGSRIARTWVLVGLLLAGGMALAVFAFLQTDWSVQPVSQYNALFQPVYNLLVGLPKVATKGICISVIAGTLIVVIPIGLCLLFAPIKRVWKLLLLISQLLLTSHVILGWSRGDMLALALTLLILPGFVNRRWRWFLAGIVTLFLGTAIILWAGNHLGLFSFSLFDFLSRLCPSRWQVWTRAVYMIRDYPFTGVGLDTFRIIAQNNYPYFDHAFDQTEHAHNLFLQAGVDQGALGIIAVLWMVVAFYLAAWRANEITRSWIVEHRTATAERQSTASNQLSVVNYQWLAAGLTGGFTAFLIGSLFDNGVASTARMALVIWAVLGLMMAVVRALSWELRTESPGQGMFAAKGRVVSTGLLGPKGFVAAAITLAFVLAIAGYPTVAGAFYNNLGNVYRDQGLYAQGLSDSDRADYGQKALASLERAVEVDHRNGWAHGNLGILYYKAANSQEVCNRIGRTPGLRFQPSGFFEGLAQVAATGDSISHQSAINYLPLATSHLQSATQLAPGDLFAHLFLAEAYRVQGRLDEAAREYVTAGAPVEYVIGEGWNRWDWGRGDYEAAVAQLTIATLMDPESAEAYYALGRCHQQQREYPAARQAYQMALQIDPQHQLARTELDKLKGAQ